MLNKWIGMGRLVRSPEVRNMPSGVSVASFTIACERNYKDADGERTTDFIDVVAWRQRAEFAGKYLEKGRMVVVEGRWQMRDYKDRDGNNRRAWEVLADNFYFADSKRMGGNEAAPATAPGEFTELTDEDDGELPF